MEPLSMIALGAAVGGAAGKFVEKAWDSGEKWLSSFFKDHGDNVKLEATNNSIDFLNELAERVKKIEESSIIPKSQIETAQDHPDFSALLQKALLTSAQTSIKEKHILLARLVSERLKSKPETTLSLASKMACDAISYASITQIKLLGLLVNIYSIRPIEFPPKEITTQTYQNYIENYLLNQVKYYLDLKFTVLDIKHLESLSCLKTLSIISRDIHKLFSKDNFSFNIDAINNVQLKNYLKEIWKHIEKIDLTTVGEIIGVYTSDIFTNKTTIFEGWN